MSLSFTATVRTQCADCRFAFAMTLRRGEEGTLCPNCGRYEVLGDSELRSLFGAPLAKDRCDESSLIEHLRRHPGDLQSWLVFGDLLQQKGDPAGELIALEHHMTKKPSEGLQARFQARLKAHQENLVGEAKELDPDLVVRIRFGHLWSLAIFQPEALKRVMERTQMRLLHQLTLGEKFMGALFRPALEMLRPLSLQGLYLKLHGVTDGEVQALLQSKHLRVLGTLDLSGSLIGEQARYRLGRALQFERTKICF